MHPIILKIGPLSIRSYGLMLAIAFVIGIILSIYRGKKVGIASDIIMDLSLIIIISAIVGARIFYVFYHITEFIQKPLKIFSLWSGGLTLYGGLIVAILASWIFIKKKKIPFLQISDVIAPAIALGLAITRIGCFLNGCCHGVPTDSSFGVVFPQQSQAFLVFNGLAIHPTQLYSSIAGLVIFGFLLFMERYKKNDGFLLALLLILYTPFRFWVESIRYHDTSIMFLDTFSMNQIISIILFILGTGLLIYIRGKSDTSEEKVNAE